MASPISNLQVIYKQIPVGMPDANRDFEIRKTTLDIDNFTLNANEVLVRMLYVSVDPYLRTRMRNPEIKSYRPALVPGELMEGYILAEILKSNDPNYIAGDVITGFGRWEQYTVLQTSVIQKIPDARNPKIPLSYYLSLLGTTGITAYVGLHKICEPLTPGQTLYVSAAAGAVGQVVGQYAKSLGLRVVGSAGDDEKVKYLMNTLKFDAAFNYKTETDFVKILEETCPNGIDIYFENVGGKMLDAVLANANNNARIAACGMISQYNRAGDPEPIYNIRSVIPKRIRLEGFIVGDDKPKYAEQAVNTFKKLLQEGKIICTESISEGIETLPQAFVGMLEGKNLGKAVVRVAEL